MSAPKIIILIGPPGAGKGTQAQFLEQKFDLFHLSSGDMLRAKALEDDHLAQQLKAVVESGAYAPDDLVLDIVHDRIQKPDCANGIILDGVPRTFYQVGLLQSVLQPLGGVPTAIIEIKIDDEEKLIERITGRSSCGTCQIIYHDVYKKPLHENMCDVCNGSLRHRQDDSAEHVARRLQDFHTNVDPVLAYYKDNGRLEQVDGLLPAQGVSSAIMSLLN